MSSQFATADDLADRWRTLRPTQQARANVLLGSASRIIRRNFPTIDADITAGLIDPETVVDVTCWMVERVMDRGSQTATKSSRQIATVTITEEREAKAGAGGLYITDDEYDLLTPPPQAPAARRSGLPRWSS